MSNKLKIVHFDNTEHDVDSMNLILFNWGIELAGKAYNKKSAKALLEDIKSKKIIPDIAIIDAFVSKSETEGEKLAEIIRDINKDVKIIGYSTYETEEWADFSVGKGEFKNDNKITDILGELIGEKYNYDNATLQVNQEGGDNKFSKFSRDFDE